MLSILVHSERKVRLTPGQAVVPVLSKGIRALVRLAMRFPPPDACGKPQTRPVFVSLVKLDAEQLVNPIVESAALLAVSHFFKTSQLPRDVLIDFSTSLDGHIQGLPSSASSARFVPHLVLGEVSLRSKINWTKDTRLLFAKGKREKGGWAND